MEVKSLHSMLIQHGQTTQNVDPKAVSSTQSETSFLERLQDGMNDVASAQSDAAELAKNYELGVESDLSKVMVAQQVSSLGFQMTLNVRNKALSAYKDIMNMPV